MSNHFQTVLLLVDYKMMMEEKPYCYWWLDRRLDLHSQQYDVISESQIQAARLLVTPKRNTIVRLIQTGPYKSGPLRLRGDVAAVVHYFQPSTDDDAVPTTYA